MNDSFIDRIKSTLFPAQKVLDKAAEHAKSKTAMTPMNDDGSLAAIVKSRASKGDLGATTIKPKNPLLDVVKKGKMK